ncbi:MAG TPA: hypothetical protein PKX08_07200 [Cyclobacteriaceae bacterium]|nr:hypothetical protein [Cyclobacteriaceae bacterium]
MRNAFIGYTYQQQVTLLLLAKMDVERLLDSIEIEGIVGHDFDDVKVLSDKKKYYTQIKDIEGISLSQVKIGADAVSIAGKSHTRSTDINIIFFRKIDIKPNARVLGIPAYLTKKVYLISLSREEIESSIQELYELNHPRQLVLNKFFSKCLDDKKLQIDRDDLPSIPVFDTRLIEPTLDMGRKHLKVKNILVIIGKPGIGKSHLVDSLAKEFSNHLIYRFWTSSQDRDYTQRLQYENFLFDFSKKLFKDQVRHTESQVLRKLVKVKSTVIIDGLDHVENYNPSDLQKFIAFIQRVQTKCKTIILTRPLRHSIKWKTHELENWNEAQTRKIMGELYHISDHHVCRKTYEITSGYPILVKYLSDYYKLHRYLPELSALKSVEEYYNSVFDQHVRMKRELTLFLCSRSFYMQSELAFFLGDEVAQFVTDFVKEYPYLFDQRLNRISLLHDSFNTYLRKQGVNYASRLKMVTQTVVESVLSGETKFLSRIAFFDLTPEIKKRVVLKYASVTFFEKVIKNNIDMEAVQSFYGDIREWLTKLSPDALTLQHYFELSLILNILSRSHTKSHYEFLFTYVRSLLANGFSEEHITSSDYVFAMLYYIKTGNLNLLQNLSSDDLHDTRNFVGNLEREIEKEILFYNKHKAPLTKNEIDKLLVSDSDHWFREQLARVLENLFLFPDRRADFPELTSIILKYIKSEDRDALHLLKRFFKQKGFESSYAYWVLNDAKATLLSLGYVPDQNDYLKLSLQELISKNIRLGSYKLSVEILNYIRLALHNNKPVDISSISLFWTKFYNRKDYSLISIPGILCVFEDKNLIGFKESVRLITVIQKGSEKGHRGLLADYIQQKPINIIKQLFKTFDMEDLHISWFELTPEYINQLPDIAYNISIRRLVEYHRSSGELDLYEVYSVLHSNRFLELKQDLDFFRLNIRVKEGSKEIPFLRKNGIRYQEYKDGYDKLPYSSESRFQYGILGEKDLKFIAKKKLTPEQVALFSDGNHSALGEVRLFEVFPKRTIKKSIRSILHSAMIGKAGSLDSFHYMFEFPGSMLRLLRDYKIDVNYNDLFKSFSRILKLSSFGLKKRSVKRK